MKRQRHDSQEAAVRALWRVLAATVASWTLSGCSVAPDAFAKVTDVAAIKADVESVKADVTGIKTGNIKVGGGGDSITAWIYAGIAAAAIFYPVAIRPVRKWLWPDDKKNGNVST